jgi:Hydrazine synthase alpha subunit middle domain
MRLRAATAVAVSLALALIFVALNAEPAKDSAAPILIYTSTAHYDALAWLAGGERFPSGAKLMVAGGTASRELVPGFFATADANVSFDGTKILFAGKKNSSDNWQIWEVTATSGDLKQLTSCTGDCVRPFHLPEGRMVYAQKADGRFQIEATPADGGDALRVTSIPGNALPTDVLRDGRILFEATYPLGHGSWAELYTVFSDGSGVESYRCDHGSDRHSGKQVQSGDIVFAKDSGVAHFTSAFAHEVDIKAPAGEFTGDVIDDGADNRIVSWRAETTDFYSLQRWNVATNTLTPLIAQEQSDLVQPQLLAPRPIPHRHPSGLHDWSGANVLCLNTYTSKLKISAGAVVSVKLYTLAEGKPLLLGTAHVESDGSFFLHVPSDQPLQVELLDKAGKSVQREQGWFWMRRGEQRVCVGCHAGPERAPENAVPQVLVKSTEPADMTGQAVTAAKGGR